MSDTCYEDYYCDSRENPCRHPFHEDRQINMSESLVCCASLGCSSEIHKASSSMMGRSLRAHFNANYFRYTSGDSNIFKAFNQNLFIKNRTSMNTNVTFVYTFGRCKTKLFIFIIFSIFVIDLNTPPFKITTIIFFKDVSYAVQG